MSEKKNPFIGMKRKRFPAMHLITAIEGGIPLMDALAGHFFVMLHDKVKHTCLIKKPLSEQRTHNEQIVASANSPDAHGIGMIFSTLSDLSLTGEEWSYIDDNEAFIFYIIANSAIEQVQRWISQGKEKPYRIPLGPLVQRPEWAVEYYDNPENNLHQDSQNYVDQIRAELEATKT